MKLPERCKTCGRVPEHGKPWPTVTNKQGKKYYRHVCYRCFDTVVKNRKRRSRPKVVINPHNRDWKTVRDSVIHDYRYARLVVKMDHCRALAWIAKGYGIAEYRVERWPIREEANLEQDARISCDDYFSYLLQEVSA